MIRTGIRSTTLASNRYVVGGQGGGEVSGGEGGGGGHTAYSRCTVDTDCYCAK